MRFCGLEMEGKLFELAGDKVLGELLIVLLPVVVVVVNGRKGGTRGAAMLELDEVVVVVVNGLSLVGLEDKGESSPPLPAPPLRPELARLGGNEYS